jgi:hypothetical protein
MAGEEDILVFWGKENDVYFEFKNFQGRKAFILDNSWTVDFRYVTDSIKLRIGKVEQKSEKDPNIIVFGSDIPQNGTVKILLNNHK